MIELAFGESAAGALKLAKSMKQGDRISDVLGIIDGTEKESREPMKPRLWSGVTMEGGPGDVAALTLALDIGDISDTNTADMNGRKTLLDELFADFPGASDEIWQSNQQSLTRLREAKSTREPVRMWVCAASPNELCGLYWMCRLMADTPTPLSVVRIPEQVEKDDCLISYRSAGEIVPEALGGFLPYEKPINGPLRKVCANLWDSLARENAPLRAVVNGSLMSVPEDFYDFALRANLPDEECNVALLIGKALNQMPGVGDRWLYIRIQSMLRSGELILVSPKTPDHPYSAVIKKGKAANSLNL